MSKSQFSGHLLTFTASMYEIEICMCMYVYLSVKVKCLNRY